MFSKRGDLRLLWLQTSPNQAKITAVQKEIRNLRDQIQDKRTSQRLAVFNVLTPNSGPRLRPMARAKALAPVAAGVPAALAMARDLDRDTALAATD